MAKKTRKRSSSPRTPRAGRKRSVTSPDWRFFLSRLLAVNAETAGLALLIVGGLLALDLIDRGQEAASILRRLFGWGALPVVIALIGVGLAMLLRQQSEQLGRQIPWRLAGETLIGLLLLLIGALGLTHLWAGSADPLAWALDGEGGGLMGWIVGWLPGALLGSLIANLLLLTLAALGGWLAVRPLGLPSIDWRGTPALLRALFSRLLPGPADAEEKGSDERQQAAPQDKKTRLAPEQLRPSIAAPAPAKPQRRPSSRSQTPSSSGPARPKPRPDHLPSLDLLAAEDSPAEMEADIQYKKAVIEHTLASFNVPAEVVDINVGPTVTQFGVKPGYLLRRGLDGQPTQRRVRVSRIKALSNDLALALEAPTLRIEAPVPGKGYVGIEAPNSHTSLVTLRAVLESPAFARLKSPLAFALGRDVSGKPVAADLEAMPHLLIAGATGSGKSVCINAIVASLLFNNGPDRLQMLLMDPKRVELPIYNHAPHLLAPVVTDPDQVVGALTWLVLQMDDRYRAFARVGARQLADYNRKVGRKRKPAQWRDLEPYPYLVLVIDELADLMMAAPDDVERLICRLAQMARATGIHLVVATQRPSVDVVTGLIKANFPARIAFSVTSQTDSRVILDTPGADKLLGRGDMLFMRPDSSKLMRIQGCFISEKEIQALMAFWREQSPPEELPPQALRYPWTGLMARLEDRDDLFEQALDLLQGQERVSVSWLQRRLRVGYDRAARLMAQMEDEGYVGPDEGGGRGREVLLAGDEGGF